MLDKAVVSGFVNTQALSLTLAVKVTAWSFGKLAWIAFSYQTTLHWLS